MTQLLSDGTSNFNAGMNAWNSPESIAQTQYFKGVNLTNRGTYLSRRPAFTEIPLTFENNYFTTVYGQKRSYAEMFYAGKFQAAIPWSRAGKQYIIAVVNGYIWQIDMLTNEVRLRSKDIFVQPNVARVNWSYADKALVLNDYPNYPVIVEEVDIFRSSADYVPISTISTYNSNRLIIANAGIEYTAGDPVGNPLTPDAPITFTEVFTPSSPYYLQFFSLPLNESIKPITAMGFIPQVDNSTGVGPLFLSTDNQIYYANVQQPRSQWEQDQNGFCKLFINNVGIAGQRAFIPLASDLIFYSTEGTIHSFSNSRNEAAKWSNIGLSREVDVYLQHDDKFLNQFAVVGYYENRILVSAKPYRTNALDRNGNVTTDYAHAGFVVLDISHIASFLQEGSPAWSGLWTGVRPLDIFNLEGNTYIFSKDGDTTIGGENRLYMIDENASCDTIRGLNRPIRSVIYTRQYNFNSPYMLKQEGAVTVEMENILGDFKFKLEQRPSHINRFLLHSVWKHSAPNDAPVLDDRFIDGIEPQNVKWLIFGDGEEKVCDPVTDDYSTPFKAVQYRITVEGDKWQLMSFKVDAAVSPMQNKLMTDFLCEKRQSVRLIKERDIDFDIPEAYPYGSTNS